MADKIMIDDFFQQVEEKLISLLSERENLLKERENLIKEREHLIKEHQHLNQDILTLKAEKAKLEMDRENHSQKLEGIVSLLDSIDIVEKTSAAVAGAVKFDLIQG